MEVPLNYRNMTEAAGLAIATTIKAAAHDQDRAAMAALGRRHGGLGNITRLLVAAGFMTPSERRLALSLNGNKIRNSCCRIRI